MWLSRTIDVVHRSPRFVMLIVLHCLNLKQQIDLSLYDLISITFLMNSLLDLYVQDVLSIVALFSLFSLLSLLSSLSRYKYLESIEHRSVNQSTSQSNFQFSDWLTYYYILSTHVNLSIRITFILSIKYRLYTWSKQSNQTHCQLNSQEFSKRISFFVTISF